MIHYATLHSRDLHALHRGIHRAIATDAAQPPGWWVHGVHVFPDWRIHARAIEAALRAKGEQFTPTGL